MHNFLSFYEVILVLEKIEHFWAVTNVLMRRFMISTVDKLIHIISHEWGVCGNFTAMMK